jgi:hypothetical protein
MSNIALSFEDTGWVAKKAPSQKDYPGQLVDGYRGTSQMSYVVIGNDDSEASSIGIPKWQVKLQRGAAVL